MKNDHWSLALKITASVSGWIAFPVILGLFIGKWLDNKFESAPWLLLLTLALCFGVSIFGLVTRAAKEFSQMEKEAAAKKVVTEDKK